MTFNSLQPGLLDACAAVKLVVTEEGSERLRKTFDPAGSFFIPSFCLFEALGVLKRKWGKERKRNREKRDRYLRCCLSLFEYVEQKRFNIIDPDINSHEIFR